MMFERYMRQRYWTAVIFGSFSILIAVFTLIGVWVRGADHTLFEIILYVIFAVVVGCGGLFLLVVTIRRDRAAEWDVDGGNSA